jgi:minor extracellular serine protease Vpr
MKINRLASLAGAMALVFASGAATAAPDRAAKRELPASIAALKLDAPLSASGIFSDRLHSSLLAAEGESRVIIRLTSPSVAEREINNDNASVHARNNLRNEQAAFLDRVRAIDPNARVIAQVQHVLNAVFVEVDAALLPQVAKDPAVMRIAPVANYERNLPETVPYIGGTAVQASRLHGPRHQGRRARQRHRLHACQPRRLGRSGRFREQRPDDHRAGHVPDAESRWRL